MNHHPQTVVSNISLNTVVNNTVVKNTVIKRLPSISASVITAILLATTLSQAQAELVIHDASAQQVKIIANQNSGAASHNTQYINNKIPTDASIAKLMQVMHIDEKIDGVINSQQAVIDIINNQASSPSQQSVNNKLNKRQRELQGKIQQLLGQYSEIMTDGINEVTDSQTLTQAYVDAVKTHFTQAEVDAQIGFYDTEMGQSILAKQPKVNTVFLQKSLPDDMSNTEQRLNELLPQMKQIIKDIW